MSNVTIVVGLGFGDEGKGSVVDALAHRHKAKLVVRFNGGAQAAHAVVLPDRRSHIFSQFGSGTFAGARTHLSRFMLVDPLSMMNEAAHLKQLGIADPFGLVTVERGALVTTPVHRTANRVREELRGAGRHGSCGMGIGETMADHLAHPDESLRIEDLESAAVTKSRLLSLYERKRAELPLPDLDLAAMVEDYARWSKLVRVVEWAYLRQELTEPGHVIFEGAQGVLLDQDHGFAPHRTWSACTFHNALALIGVDHSEPVERIGVIRTYATRHGAGPFPTEDPELAFTERHNNTHAWQGEFRLGAFDAALTNYAIRCCNGVDGLAVTHADCADHIPRISPGYEGDPPITAETIATARPRYRQLPNESALDAIAETMSVPFRIVSRGPTHIDKEYR